MRFARNDEYVEISAEIKYMTEKAVLVNDGDRDVWIPKSQIDEPDELEEGVAAGFFIKKWFAKKEGLI